MVVLKELTRKWCKTGKREPSVRPGFKRYRTNIQGSGGSICLICPVFLGMYHIGFSSVQFSRSVVSDSLRPHGLQHTRPPCPSPTPGVYSNLCPLSQWCYPTISSSVVRLSSHFQSFPALGSFQTSQFSPCPVLTVTSWPAYRFLSRQVNWSGIPISLRIFHSLLWSTQSKALT